VLSFGAPPTFQPSGWEWAFRAAALQQSDRATAREILEDGLRANPESASLYYGLACVEALDGRHENSLTALRKAIELGPEVKEWAREDADFQTLQDDTTFRALIGI
jgi:cytochrome c-type biogenesis protein CcmH/NrfG